MNAMVDVRGAQVVLTQARLKQVVHYDLNTGLMTWLIKARGAHNREIGQRAGWQEKRGVWRVAIDGRQYLVHQLAWLYVTGEWTPRIDHEDLDPSNNRWLNLRKATQSQNLANRGPTKANKSGLKGVSWCERDGKWQAKITVNYKQTHLGWGDCPAALSFEYQIAADRAFGEFARIA